MSQEHDARPQGDAQLPLRIVDLVGVALLGPAAAALIGALLNAVNARICPAYFVAVMGWEEGPALWGRIVVQGIFEGLCLGAMLGGIFATGVGTITRCRAPFTFAAHHLAGVGLGALACSMLGGLSGVGLALLSPEWLGPLHDVPLAQMPRCAWVGGSILGVELGGLASVAIGLVVLRARWRDQLEASPAPAHF